MKFILGLLLVVTACSKNPGTSIPSPDSDIDMSLSAETVDLTQTGSELSLSIVGGTSIEFGAVEAGKTATKDITFSSKTAISVLDLSAFDSLSAPFSKVSSSCGTSMLRSRTCKVSLKFSPSLNASAESLSIAPMINGNLPLQINASITVPVPPVEVPGANLTISPLDNDLGTFTSAILSKNISITNPGTTSKSLALVFPASSEFITTHTCAPASAPVLARSRTCQVQVKFSTSEKPEEDTLKEYAFTINGKEVKVKALVKGNAPVAPPSATLTITPNPVVLGEYKGLTLFKDIIISNVGTVPGTVTVVASTTPEFSLSVPSACASLARARSCVMKLSFTSTEKPEVDTTKDYSFTVNGVTVSASALIKAVVPEEVTNFSFQSPAISFGPLASASTKRIVLENTGTTNITNLSISAPEGASIEATTCLPALNRARNCYIDVKLDPAIASVGAYSKVLTISNFDVKAEVALSANIQGPSPVTCGLQHVPNSLTVSGIVPSCQAMSCQDNYTLSAGACSPTLCSSLDIPGSFIVQGNKVSGCVLVSCIEDYTASGNSCSENPPLPPTTPEILSVVPSTTQGVGYYEISWKIHADNTAGGYRVFVDDEVVVQTVSPSLGKVSFFVGTAPVRYDIKLEAQGLRATSSQDEYELDLTPVEEPLTVLKERIFADASTAFSYENKSVFVASGGALSYYLAPGFYSSAQQPFFQAIIPKASANSKHYKVEVAYTDMINCPSLTFSSASGGNKYSTNTAASGKHTFEFFNPYFSSDVYMFLTGGCLDGSGATGNTAGTYPERSIKITSIKVMEFERPAIVASPGVAYSRQFMSPMSAISGETVTNMTFTTPGLKYENAASTSGGSTDPMCLMSPWMPQCMSSGGTGSPGMPGGTSTPATPGSIEIDLSSIPLVYYGQGNYRVEVTYQSRTNVQIQVQFDSQGGNLIQEGAEGSGIFIHQVNGLYYGNKKLKLTFQAGSSMLGGNTSTQGSIFITQVRLILQ